MTAPDRYSSAQILLHWLVAGLISLQFLLHEGMEMAFEAQLKGTSVSATQEIAANSHVAFGLVIFLLAGIRVFLRVTHGVPALPSEEHAVLQLLAKGTHFLLYTLLLGLPIGGALAWFQDAEWAGDLHGFGAGLLFFVVLLHIAGALVQHFVLKTDVLRRMTRSGS